MVLAPAKKRWGVISTKVATTPTQDLMGQFREPTVLSALHSSGDVIFKQGSRSKESAKFAVLPDSASVDILCDLLETVWKLEPPSVLLSVTGSAQDMALDSKLVQRVTSGLSSAARSTNAWVFTGGMDAGVMAMTGKALRGLAQRAHDVGSVQTPCIGIAPWRKVTHREKLYSPPEPGNGPAHDMEVFYVKRKTNSRASAALDALHTHFLLVCDGAAAHECREDATGRAAPSTHAGARRRTPTHADARRRTPTRADRAPIVRRSCVPTLLAHADSLDSEPRARPLSQVDDGKEEFGGEIALRGALEATLAQRYKVPAVLLVVQGGPGTYATVIRAVEMGQRIVLVKESKGAAQARAAPLHHAPPRTLATSPCSHLACRLRAAWTPRLSRPDAARPSPHSRTRTCTWRERAHTRANLGSGCEAACHGHAGRSLVFAPSADDRGVY